MTNATEKFQKNMPPTNLSAPAEPDPVPAADLEAEDEEPDRRAGGHAGDATAKFTAYYHDKHCN